MKSTRNSHSCSNKAAGIEATLCTPTSGRPRVSLCLCVLLFASLLSVFSLQADSTLEEYEYGESDFILRISAQSHSSGIYNSAKTLASLFNWQQLWDDLSGGKQRAIPIATNSAESSLRDLVERRSELAIVRADLADQLFNLSSKSGTTESESLRLVSTHIPAFLHIVVRGDYTGATVKSLDGKRVNIGGDSETVRRDFEQLLGEAGSYIADTEFVYAPVADGLKRLETGAVDAVMFFDQAPSDLVAEKLENRKYRLLPYNEIRDGGIGRASTPDSQYFGQATSADFYKTPQHVRSLTLATYLLTRDDVPQGYVDTIVQLLNIQPQTDVQDRNNASLAENSSAIAAAENSASDHLRPNRISESLSPIPLHPSSQLLIDIFADPQTTGDPQTTRNRSDTLENSPGPSIASRQAEQ